MRTDGDAEYRASEAIKRMIFAEDPHRLMFGSIACGETWYWTEEGAGLGMDVMMKEGYGSAVGGGGGCIGCWRGGCWCGGEQGGGHPWPTEYQRM